MELLTFQRPFWRFAARAAGLASGLAVAVRPAGAAQVSGVKGGRLGTIALASDRRERS